MEGLIPVLRRTVEMRADGAQQPGSALVRNKDHRYPVTKVELTVQHQLLLRLADGRRNIVDIIEASGYRGDMEQAVDFAKELFESAHKLDLVYFRIR